MDIQEYISSGILELYVYGSLSELESREVTRMVNEYPEVKAEVEKIEAALRNLSAAAAPSDTQPLFAPTFEKILGDRKVVKIDRRKTNWPAYLGWAASLLFLIGLFVLFNENQQLKESLQALEQRNTQIENEIADARNDAEKTRELLNVLRDKNILEVDLGGQAIAPEAYATAYWDREENITFIDARELPEPPRGMVYQVWSLKLNPLTPTSLGLLENFEEDENKIFRLENAELSEGFGITLEPAGGSESPTLEKLYVLGTTVSS